MSDHLGSGGISTSRPSNPNLDLYEASNDFSSREHVESSCWQGITRNIIALFNLIIDGLRSLFSCCCDTHEGHSSGYTIISLNLSERGEETKRMFSDGQAYLLDQTAQRVVTIVQDEYFNLLENKKGKSHDKIHINGQEVLFSSDLDTAMLFGSKFNTDHVIVEDDEDNEGVYRITEVQITQPENTWRVDTKKQFQINQTAGVFSLGSPQKVYLVENEVPKNYNSLASGAQISEPGWGPMPKTLFKA